MVGSFIQTLVLTDVATGWTECVPVITRSAPLIIAAIHVALDLFPFPLRGIDFDNDGSFMNDQVVPWCRGKGLIVTRSRAYKKNDQAWVEQKYGAIVRRLVGYGRLVGLDALDVLGRLYAASRIQTNFCHPSFKLVSKSRIGAKVKKTWDRPRTPAARLLAHPDILPETRSRVANAGADLDPVEVMHLIRKAQAELGDRIDQRGAIAANVVVERVIAPSDRESVRNLAGSKTLPNVQRRRYRRTKPIPTKASRLDPHVSEIKIWLEVDRGLTSLAIHDRLTAAQGVAVSKRTVQRLVRRLRSEMIEAEIKTIAQRLVMAA